MLNQLTVAISRRPVNKLANCVEKIELNLAVVATKSLKFSNDTETLNPLAPTGVINFTNVSKP